MTITNEKIRLALQIALLGEIYLEIRAIAFKYTPAKKSLLVRYYLDREPVKTDFESISCVMTEVISNFKFSDFNEIREECQYCVLPKNKIEPLDGFVYFRKE